MRKDLNKQLCERERAQHDDKYGFYRHSKKHDQVLEADGDDGLDEPFTGVGATPLEPMKARHGTKSFNENLRPLYGFIHSRCGMPWDAIYSEICQVFDKRSVINQHILIHLNQYVETKTILIGDDGNLWYRSESSSIHSKPELLKDSQVRYYVDPRDGVLYRNKDYKTTGQRNREYAATQRAKEAKVCRIISKELELRCFDGIWFEIKFEEVEGTIETTMQDFPHRKNFLQTKTVYPYRFDVLQNMTVAQKRVAISKHQLSRKDLRKYDLTNNPK